ncbi:toxin-antitoxin system HicB family antitoxin [Sediminispirochaeta smaragdinae]|uniref:CopG domain protein DNA-binding domain protein n=1 Tax=Sediminispirochaeta smaragdinae (strain DSM 11293 / JCM 15392 / SEBR 4228) TaxID=573413 RepID=E1R8K5_SEDSS|nr:toxin-antitoxin system HicB family antitoxin [Sediminispirochaeta smaragdinae]ADK79349.1 CopG domain protein DNA-binding domain protein [Sediminispirochaeta smaragdinae DSM 11293]
MSSLSIRIPESLHETLKKISKKDRVSINQFIASAVAEKVTALETEEYIKVRGEKGTIDKFNNVLSKVKNIEAEENDT